MCDNKVKYNFFPFDNVHGEKDKYGNVLSKEQLMKEGVLIKKENIPSPNPPHGMESKLNVDILNQTVYYTYEFNDTVQMKKNLQEQLTILSKDLAESKVRDMKNSASIQSLTKEIARLKIQLMNNKGVN
ncbi:TPA: hypothetical protein PTW06_003595 [Clostridium botulinum]|nr:hypothetical protein [Clostridium botulinum]HDK7226266.1 hypothetical protein [Clostridium botulinum]HDK7273656.1 hypothetical protein [Clostridium botulinum]HDK7307004.1 hypothetical protein [Clostridium botulinum]